MTPCYYCGGEYYASVIINCNYCRLTACYRCVDEHIDVKHANAAVRIYYDRLRWHYLGDRKV